MIGNKYGKVIIIALINVCGVCIVYNNVAPNDTEALHENVVLEREVVNVKEAYKDVEKTILSTLNLISQTLDRCKLRLSCLSSTNTCSYQLQICFQVSKVRAESCFVIIHGRDDAGCVIRPGALELFCSLLQILKTCNRVTLY